MLEGSKRPSEVPLAPGLLRKTQGGDYSLPKEQHWVFLFY